MKATPLPLHNIGDFVEVFNYKAIGESSLVKTDKSLGYGLITRAQWSPNKEYWGYMVFVPSMNPVRLHSEEFAYEMQIEKINHHWEWQKVTFKVGDLVEFKVPSRGASFMGEYCILLGSNDFVNKGVTTKLWTLFHQNKAEYVYNVLEAELEKAEK